MNNSVRRISQRRTNRSVLTHGSRPKISASLSVDKDDDPTKMCSSLKGREGVK